MMELSGRVIKEWIARGSKSEREAVLLDTKSGRYVLRRLTGNPFHDPELEKLVGKTIRCTGNLTGYTLIMSDWTEIKDEAEDESK